MEEAANKHVEQAALTYKMLFNKSLSSEMRAYIKYAFLEGAKYVKDANIRTEKEQY